MVEQGSFDYESGYASAVRPLRLQPRPTAIVASNDHVATGALAAAHQSGIEIPRKLSAAGFDDTSIARFAWPPPTTVCQPISLVAQVATEVLLKQLQGRVEKVADRRLSAQIVYRAPTGPAG